MEREKTLDEIVIGFLKSIVTMSVTRIFHSKTDTLQILNAANKDSEGISWLV